MPLATLRPQTPQLHTQDLRTLCPKLSDGCVLLGILRAVETDLRTRRVLSGTKPGTLPLWFLAETERNIFLWRNSQSIADASSYTFWIDVPALITKRRAQLKKADEADPFSNPMWGADAQDPSCWDHERDYLDVMEDLLPTVFRRASMLSDASETLRKEIAPQIDRIPVLLPRGIP